MMTGDVSDQTLATCFEHGATDYVTKPIKGLVLMARVNSAVDKQNYLKKTQEQQEILAIRMEELTLKEEMVTLHKNKLVEAARRTTESINYARTIQHAMLPSFEKIKAKLDDFFILFKPRDIVSGDFYWFSEVKQQNEIPCSKIVLAAIDCTGHGVPGAFVSLVGDAYLNQIVNMQKITAPDKILNLLHQHVKQALKQDETSNNDGMDISLCVIDQKDKILEFAGAKNSFIYIQNNQLHEIKGDATPIGGAWGKKEKERTFTKKSIHIDQPTMCYVFSDGYQDQFGGEDGRKFMKRRLKALLLSIHHLPVEEQKEVMETTLNQWMNYSNNIEKRAKQLDDILVIGFRL